jgi:hypothetical protein
MTDLKELLDDAAGPEPAVTDADLATDLARGRHALRRRRATGAAAGAVATAAAIAVAWSVLPGDTNPNTVAPITGTTSTPSPSAIKTTGKGFLHPPTPDRRPHAPKPAVAVPLVVNNHPFPGSITCDLIPKGWRVRLTVPAAKGGGWEQKELSDPDLSNPQQYREHTFTLTIRQSQLMDEGQGLTGDKYLTPWTKLPKVRAGANEAVITTPLGDKDPNGLREVFVRQGQGIRVVVVTNNAYNLGWDSKTLLRFAGSCHYK